MLPATIGHFVLGAHSETLRDDGKIELIVRYATTTGDEARVAFAIAAATLKAFRLTIMTKVLDEIKRQIDVIESGRVLKSFPEGG